MTQRNADKVSCGACGHGVSKVLDSRGPLRLRECLNPDCCARFLTGENIVKMMPRTSRRVPTHVNAEI